MRLLSIRINCSIYIALKQIKHTAKAKTNESTPNNYRRVDGHQYT